jgi:hypothetical protein
LYEKYDFPEKPSSLITPGFDRKRRQPEKLSEQFGLRSHIENKEGVEGPTSIGGEPE